MKPALYQQFRSPLTTPFQTSRHVLRVLDVIRAHKGQGILVGGCVRDHLMGMPAKDIDVEVYGIDEAKLDDILSKYFSVSAVGKSFGIYKVTVGDGDDRETIDVALPRRENKAGLGHRGFVVTTDPLMPFAEASERRDFTINAMGIDNATSELLDPHGGLDDLHAKRLKHVGEAFKEDPF
jgi:tRNA nucleotidyltransferase (CCA-adding enzyme)